MKALDYQARVLDTLDTYLDKLKAAKAIHDAQVDALKTLGAAAAGMKPVDFAEQAWTQMKAEGRLPGSRAAKPFSPRFDGAGRVVPNVTFKVPTGGGKTYLAVNAVSRIFGRYLGRNAGFVLWIVPNEAIYAQTLKNLKDRDHPYRQALDRASANRTKIMEKGDHLHAMDVEGHLCVMILMLQSGNRQNKDTLKMFRDRGDVNGFFPAEGEQQAHEAMLDAVPNLDHYADFGRMVKDSLGNALRLIQPVVVMDEGQKATSALAFETLYGFNPMFVLELTATPKDVAGRDGGANRLANLLVEVTGRELHQEDMIKMPLNLEARQGDDWKATLNAAVDRLGMLQRAATAHQGDTGRYIRPILLVQVERTGRDQRDGTHIHAEDVRDWLKAAGFDDPEIAVKTAEQNDLSQPENLDLLSETNRVRVIITKAALQEGWDCPFAYVLCSLAASTNLSAMTQLVGRILRQPYATKTGVDLLDECHVLTHHADTGRVIAAIKQGLESDGLADLVIAVTGGGSGGGQDRVARPIPRRQGFEKLDIYLPRVLWTEGGETRDLDYETDLLARLDWRGFDPGPVAALIPDNAQEVAAQMQRIGLSDDGSKIVAGKSASPVAEDRAFDPSYAVRIISDLVPNPFVARDIVGGMVAALRNRGFDDEKIGRLSGLIIDTMRKGLDADRTARAEALFRSDVQAGRIQFRLRLDGQNWEMPSTATTMEPAGSRVLAGSAGSPVAASLFAPFYEADLNTDERGVAVMLDEAKTIRWWHRNVAKSQYGLQGWKRGRIYPDFIFAVSRDKTDRRIVALETKGDHLQNPDTDYKRAVLDLLSDEFRWDTAVPAGQLQLQNTGEVMDCKLILMSDIPTQLPKLL
jgi:type III restriction enzyme